MKKLKFYFAALSMVLLLGCQGCDEEPLNLLAEIPFRVEFEIPAGINIFEDHFFQFPNLPNNYQNILTQQGIDPSRVKRINPASTRMSVQFDNTSLSFIREASLYLFSDQVGRQSEAFWTPEIPFNQSDILNIPGTLIDASDFFEESWINMELRLDTREVPSSFINVRLDILFHVVGE
ncbi:MAG: hypothetical protein HKN16_02795 [Saprospiraceae bacterium]|nr:hypothetical protein [Saprospiraceae bacterium]